MTTERCQPLPLPILLALVCIAPISQCCQDLLCYVDFYDKLTCEYRKDQDLNTSVSYTLSASWTFEEWNTTCLLVECEKKHEYICTIDMDDFSSDDLCEITITTNINGRYQSNQNCQPFKIGDKFKPLPPVNLTVSLHDDYNISWETYYDAHVMRSGELVYELSYKKERESWLNQTTLQILEDEKNLILLRTLLQGGEQYKARIRAQPKNTSTSIYHGEWSEWSASVTWTTPDVDQNIKTQIGTISWIMSGMLVFLGIVMTCCRYTPIMWKKVWVLVPDPEPFFKPLYKGHEGDFKSWLGPHYAPFPIPPLDGSCGYPEVLEIDYQSSGNHKEVKKPLLPKSCMKENPAMRCSSQCPPSTTTTDGSTNERDSSEDDGYPSMDLDSDNMWDHLLDQGSKLQSTVMLQEDILRSNTNMLDLVSIPPEDWEVPESPSPEDDENVFYNDDNYNPLSPDSSNSGNFGYPRICLDMDTIDSGFVDSECGSPVDSDFGNSDITTKPQNPDPYDEEDDICDRHYVQQWVPSTH
ncbi:interleukin-21 receptor-like [Leptodactylus fuscus]|uniref:interleukin-21 receptor-like n=1 Tax=Leptodactylus fuscus TaxID=238119 RepID=UPI003F4E54AD